jgi:hypothetical protein
MSMWVTGINVIVATAVVMVGAWLGWGSLAGGWWIGLFLVLGVFLFWRGKTIGEVWAWATLLLGGESLAWPITTMMRARMSSVQPSEEEMGLILNAVLFGLFSSVFWISFAIGLFRRRSRSTDSVSQDQDIAITPTATRSRRNRRRS